MHRGKEIRLGSFAFSPTLRGSRQNRLIRKKMPYCAIKFMCYDVQNFTKFTDGAAASFRLEEITFRSLTSQHVYEGSFGVA